LSQVILLLANYSGNRGDENPRFRRLLDSGVVGCADQVSGGTTDAWFAVVVAFGKNLARVGGLPQNRP
jgi:hypothetical protein